MKTLLVICALVACAAAAPADKRDRRWVSGELLGVDVGYYAPQLLTVNKVVNTQHVVEEPQVVSVRKVVSVPQVVSVNKLVAAPTLYSGVYSDGWW